MGELLAGSGLDGLRATIAVTWGRLRLRTIALAHAGSGEVRVMVAGRAVAARADRAEDGKLVVVLAEEVVLVAGEGLEIVVKAG